MPELIERGVTIPVPGGKSITEFVGHAATQDDAVSIAVMDAPAGWDEPFQAPDFDEFTVVLAGQLIVDHDLGTTIVSAGQAVVTRAGERIRYRTAEGARYVAICLPAFHIDLARREEG